MSDASVTYYVDEAGDGVLFGPKGRDRLQDEDAPRFFMLGMVQCADEAGVIQKLVELRDALQKNPLYATIYSLRPEAKKTARAFHAKDDHAEIRSKVFELLVTLDFKFYAVVKDMRAVRDYVKSRNGMAGENKKPMDIGFTGLEARDTRHGAEFCPPAQVIVTIERKKSNLRSS